MLEAARPKHRKETNVMEFYDTEPRGIVPLQRMARPREPRSRSEMEAEARRVAEPYVQKMSRIWMIQSRTVIFLEDGEWHVEQRISDEWQAEVEALRAQMNLAISSTLGAAHWPSEKLCNSPGSGASPKP